MIRPQDIEDFEAKYVGSEMEIEDLKDAYVDAEGDLDGIFERVPCCSAADEERFRSILSPFIESGELTEFPAWAPDEKKRKRRAKRAEREAKEAEQLKAELGLKPGQSLESAILARRGGSTKSLEEQIMSKHGEQMTGIADALAAKYGPGGPAEKKEKGRRTGKKKKMTHAEPSEEEFAALQAKMFGKR